jgi:hypothetical protein
MAQYTITHTCGHVETVNLYGPGYERERKIAWLEGQECRDCYKARQNAAGREYSDAHGLPELTGSEKQIAWAHTLRMQAHKAFSAQDAVAEVLSYLRGRAQQFGLTVEMVKATGYGPEEFRGLVQREIDKVFAGETEAGWWIDSRPRGRHDNSVRGDWDEILDDPLCPRIVAAIQAAGAVRQSETHNSSPASQQDKPSRKQTLRMVMRRAWEIARSAAARLGVRVREIVFGECLRLAWAEARKS